MRWGYFKNLILEVLEPFRRLPRPLWLGVLILPGDEFFPILSRDPWLLCQRSLAALALRIAFSLALARNLGMLVLDEPTHNLDVNAIDELAITLRERLPNLIDQIFLITHEERLESAVSGYLYKLERNKELDEPTKVNLVASPEI